jgi:hypothetical protein
MKLILEYHDSSYEYSFDVTIPIEYESEEDLICDFEAALKLAVENNLNYFEFLNMSFDRGCFYNIYSKEYFLPEISTLDDWFARKMLYKI